MAFKHGKDTVFKVNSVDLSAYTSESEIPRSTDTHDVSAYGVDAHTFAAGLNNATATASGTYDTTASTGPRAALLAVYALNAAVTVVRQPEGTGTGKPQDSFSAILTGYTETNPVADMIKWKADFQVSGDISTTAQA
jgi:hypothetical protein